MLTESLMKATQLEPIPTESAFKVHDSDPLDGSIATTGPMPACGWM